MTSFTLEPVYGSTLFAIALTAAVVVVIALAVPNTPNPKHRRILMGLRILAALILLLATFRPSLVRTDQQPAEATLIVGLDRSESMTLSDGEGSDRWTTQTNIWQQLVDGISDLDDELALQLIMYDQNAIEVTDPGANSLAIMTPNGKQTDLASMTREVLTVAAGKPIAGVVIVGDGTQTADVVQGGPQRSVLILDSIGVPMWAVPVGPAGDAGSSRDVAITGLPDSFRMFAGNQVSVNFQAQLKGLAASDVKISLIWVDMQGAETEAATREIFATDADQTIPLSVPLTAPTPGVYRLVVRAAEQPGELVTVNNTQVAFVDVSEGGGRIFYLEGYPRLEQTFLRRSLSRFPDLDLTYQWIPANTSASWPLDLGNTFEPGQHDIYILGDIDSAAIGNQQLQRLSEAVSGGAGLVMLGGLQNYSVGGYATSPLSTVLPIKLDAALRQAQHDENSNALSQLAGPIVIRPTKDHPIIDLGGNDLAKTWNQLPSLSGATKFSGPKLVPGTQVLLESEQANPLLVVGEYGGGRTAAVAFDSSWRWWRSGHDQVHRRFWRQLMLWLLARDNLADNQIQLTLDARRFASETPPNFHANVTGLASGESLELTSEIVDESGKATPVPTSRSSATGSDRSADADQQLTVAGTIPTLAPGFYRLRVQASQPTDKFQPAERAFQVIQESRELSRPAADPGYLQQLAELTADHGGAAFHRDEIDQLIDLLKDRRRKAETTIVQRHRLGDGPVTGWLMFSIFAVALGTEWWLRKKWGLV